MHYSVLAASDVLRAIFLSVKRRAFSRKQNCGQKIRLVIVSLVVLCLMLALAGLTEAVILSVVVFLVMRWIHLGVFDIAGGAVFTLATIFSLLLVMAAKGYKLSYGTVLSRIQRVDFFPEFPYNDQTFTKSLTDKEIHYRDSFWGSKMPMSRVLSPNLLTMTRALGATLLVFFHSASVAIFFPAVFVLALTDFFDGIIARTQGRVTAFGKWADPIADRMLLFAVAVFLYQRNPEFWISATGRMLVPEMVFLLTGFVVLVVKRTMVPRAVFWGRLKFILYLVSVGGLFCGCTTLAWICLNIGCFFSWVATISYITRFYQENRNKSIFNGTLEWFVGHSPRIREELSTC